MKDERTRKKSELLSFYKKQNKEIKFRCKNGLRVIGKVKEIKTKFHFFKQFVIVELEEDSLMKVFLDDIIDNTIYPAEIELPRMKKIMEEEKGKERKSIPKSVKNELWGNHFGHNFHGRCFVCKRKIERDYFEAGHVKAVATGGSDTLDNLRPICRTRNRSMGTMNLSDFKQRYH